MHGSSVNAPTSLSDPVEAAFEAYRGQVRFSCLDGIRFISIMAVLWHHSAVHVAMENPPMILKRGFLGVDFFFVLSGFLITTLLLREAAHKGSISLKSFYWRRILRIVPIYFLVVCAASAYVIAVRGEMQYAPLVPYYFLFLANFLSEHIPLLTPTWSLSVEEQYYMLWPLLLVLLPRRTVLPVLGVLIAVNVAGVMGAFAPLGIRPFDWGPLRFALPNSTYAPILIGSALAVLLHHRKSFLAILPVFGHRLAPLAAFAFLAVLLQVSPPDVRGLPNLAIHLSMAAALTSIVIRDDNILTPLMAWRPVARIGEISYGIYLYHLFTLSLVNIVLSKLTLYTPWAEFVLNILLVIIVSETSFRTYERFFLKFRHRV